MSKLYFRYAAMNAGKSTNLLQVAYNYEERGQVVVIYTAGLDDRAGRGVVSSRLDVERPARTFSPETSFAETLASRPACILIDEAQFLTPAQVRELHRLSHEHRVPVICYGLRTDFRGAGFAGSLELLAIADTLEEMKTICRCGRKATMVIRHDEKGERIFDGAQVQVGGNETYESVCPSRFYRGSC
ncbi:thymidine kinase [Usitatibacter palustris]|uniref:Thymidine kinase n=1 Tax=Usitatibacter palustris TaxID=2732487 RepID=A0A6M4H1X4_9PROT|nr:thymidine kinase [Usitatibacter palustris]QJR13521.1 Thymidine kinase [Usitatibacter palustris]